MNTHTRIPKYTRTSTHAPTHHMITDASHETDKLLLGIHRLTASIHCVCARMWGTSVANNPQSREQTASTISHNLNLQRKTIYLSGLKPVQGIEVILVDQFGFFPNFFFFLLSIDNQICYFRSFHQCQHNIRQYIFLRFKHYSE